LKFPIKAGPGGAPGNIKGQGSVGADAECQRGPPRGRRGGAGHGCINLKKFKHAYVVRVLPQFLLNQRQRDWATHNLSKSGF